MLIASINQRTQVSSDIISIINTAVKTPVIKQKGKETSVSISTPSGLTVTPLLSLSIYAFPNAVVIFTVWFTTFNYTV